MYMYGCRCDQRLKGNTEGAKLLTYTGLCVSNIQYNLVVVQKETRGLVGNQRRKLFIINR
jgi:hypothetical protein